MNELINKLKSEFHDKETRQVYIDEFLNSSIATQIKVLREQRGWNQERLAQEADMKQSRISVLEDVNYSSWSIKTLRRLAEAFDLTLSVSFEEFGTRLRELEQLSRESLQRRSFNKDPVFNKQDDTSLEMSAESALKEESQLKRHQPKSMDILSDVESSRGMGLFSFTKPQNGLANQLHHISWIDKGQRVSALL